jgi:adenosylmethionine-8-amino-7-oxononanoate aminotransferase
MTDILEPTIAYNTKDLQDTAAKHLWRHFTKLSSKKIDPVQVFVSGDGCYITDSDGNRFLDGLAGLLCVTIGYGFGKEIGAAAADQYSKLVYTPSWGTTHPPGIELARVVAELAPEGMNHVHFTPSGGESVEAAWKMTRQYHRIRGENRWKAIARHGAYHGTTMGALSLMGITHNRTPFEPLTPGAIHVRHTGRHDRPEGETDEAFAKFLLEDLEFRIEAEDPKTIAMMIVEPVQSHGVFAPPPGYNEGVRALCTKYGILLVADETVTAWGRFGKWFASERYGLRPDVITTAKGLSSAHAVIGCVIASDDVYNTFADASLMFTHGNTFGGHPVAAAVALKNIEIIKRLDLVGHVAEKESEFLSTLNTLRDLSIVRDIRGAGFLYCIELNIARQDGTQRSAEETEGIYGTSKIEGRLGQDGVILRSGIESGIATINIGPPLVADTDEFNIIVNALRKTLVEVSRDAGYPISSS